VPVAFTEKSACGSRGVDDERDFLAEFFEKIFDGCAVADVEIVVFVIGKFIDELLAVAKR
jgi:hypothetical protein